MESDVDQSIVNKNETLTSFDKGMRTGAAGVAFENAPAFDLHEMSPDDYVICCSVDGKSEVLSGDNSGVMFIVIAGGLVDSECESGCWMEAYGKLVE